MSYSNLTLGCAYGKSVALVGVALVLIIAAPALAQAQTVPGKSSTGWSSLAPDAQRAITAALKEDDPAWTQQAELSASDGKGGDAFGNSVAVSGSTAVVGAPGHMIGLSSGQGAAYVFVQSGGTWSQQAELTASDGAAYDRFGGSVTISGSTVVVGAAGHTVGSNPYQGAAYVFVESGGTWSQQAELTASDGAAHDGFGNSVAVSGSTAVVGASCSPASLSSGYYVCGPGAAYVFVQSGGTWNQQAELTASDGAAADQFGGSVAVSDSTIVVGAPVHTVGSNQYQGAAYVFVESGGAWSQQAELTASDGVYGDALGYSVAVGGGTVLVGAPWHLYKNPYAGPGAAYAFVESGGTWSQQAELTASDGQGGDEFGQSIAVSGSTAVVGASGHVGSSHGEQGAAYVFAESGGTWSQQAELTGSDGAAGDGLGDSVAISGSTVLAGAPGRNSLQGAAYVFGSSSSQPTVTLSPASLSFGNEAVNYTSAAKTVTLKNTGNATLQIISSIEVTPSTNFKISSNTCTSTLAAGKSCKLGVEFTPMALGALTASLVFTDNASNSPQTVALSGTGVLPATLTPAGATYAAQNVDTTSKPKTFTLTNNQTLALTSIATSTTGDFAVSATTCGTNLGAKAKCTISVTFTPMATGTRTGQLIVSDSASNSPQTSDLTGTGK